DNGVPPLSATNSFVVIVTEVNSAPALPAQSNRTINELTLLVVTNTASDSDLPANTLSYVLAVGPTNAVIDGNGVINWTPSEAQGPSTNIFSLGVTENGVPALSATNSFTVIVTEVNSAPVLTMPANQTLAELTTLNVNTSATDSDIPANTLTFALVSAPLGMSINPVSGAISSTAHKAQRP